MKILLTVSVPQPVQTRWPFHLVVLRDHDNVGERQLSWQSGRGFHFSEKLCQFVDCWIGQTPKKVVGNAIRTSCLVWQFAQDLLEHTGVDGRHTNGMMYCCGFESLISSDVAWSFRDPPDFSPVVFSGTKAFKSWKILERSLPWNVPLPQVPEEAS